MIDTDFCEEKSNCKIQQDLVGLEYQNHRYINIVQFE